MLNAYNAMQLTILWCVVGIEINNYINFLKEEKMSPISFVVGVKFYSIFVQIHLTLGDNINAVLGPVFGCFYI